MASALKSLSEYDEANFPDISEHKFGIVVSDYNSDITFALYDACLATLVKHGAQEDNIHTIQVPGTFELPAGARILAGSERLDAVICLGCVIKGETDHDKYINQAVANAIANLSIASGKPCIFGVLTPNTKQQALDRAGGKHGNKGVEAAVAAIRMVGLKKETKASEKRIGFN